MSDAITYNQFFQGAAEGLKLGPDRHPKWQRVEPGTVIPAGQPYRAEWDEPQGPQAVERTSSYQQTAPPSPEWFIDSSWKPPLVLPTEPTWGIAVHVLDKVGTIAGRCRLDGDEFLHPLGSWRAHNIADFIPLTDEQVQRIEAAR